MDPTLLFIVFLVIVLGVVVGISVYGTTGSRATG
jgi:hypothetical protein